MSATGSGSEDVVPPSYPYYWSPTSDITVEEFVKKYKPSMVQNDGTKPWLWVRNSNDEGEQGDREAAVKEAKELLTKASDRVKEINEDDSIPARSSKKAGKGKKQYKDELAVEYSEKLKEVHTKYNYKSGKWLVFISPDQVDAAWSKLAVSVVNGPLSKTAIHLAKVATTPANESSALRVMCIYMPDVLDKEKVTETMKILLRNHGLSLSGVKSNLYTEIGLDSKHPSHIQSTIWKNIDILKDVEIKELRAAYFEELNGDTGKKGGAKDGETEPAKKKGIMKAKPATDDPFGDDDDEAPNPKKKAAVRHKPVAEDPFGSDDEPKPRKAPAKRKAKVDEEKKEGEDESQPKRAPAKRKTKTNEESEEDEDGPKPKKRRAPVKKKAKAEDDDDER